jgi:large subunit ribosomal protein L23
MFNLNLYDVIRRPLISEKSTDLLKLSKYTFEVDEKVSKDIVKKAVEKIFNVKVCKINIQNVRGDNTIFKGKKGVQRSKKKAVVTLMKDYSIDFIGGVR